MGHLKVCSVTPMPPLSVPYLGVTIHTESGTLLTEGNLRAANIVISQHPLATGMPYLLQSYNFSQITNGIKNCLPVDVKLKCNLSH